MASLMTFAATSRADEPKSDAQSEIKLVGTWELETAKYGTKERKSSEETTPLKRVTWTRLM